MEQRILNQFAEQIKMQFDVYNVTIYQNQEKICGSIKNDVQLERCLSLTCTTVFKEPQGSTMVSHIGIGNHLYIVILDSTNSTAFDGLDAQYIISELKKLKEHLEGNIV